MDLSLTLWKEDLKENSQLHLRFHVYKNCRFIIVEEFKNFYKVSGGKYYMDRLTDLSLPPN